MMEHLKQKSVAAVTLGCKLNYAESSVILDKLVLEGWKLSSIEEGADLIIIHTCAVTGKAERRSRQQTRSIIRSNPASRVAVIGCCSQLDPERIAEIDGVSIVLGTQDKFCIPYYTDQPALDGDAPFVKVSSVRDACEACPANSLLTEIEKGRTRAFLKIQDGCSYGCAYCTIPRIRGRSRSVPLDVVLDSARQIVQAGYREIVLTGVNIADYHDGNRGFSALLKRLEEVDISRIRIGSVEPDLLDDDLLATVAASKKIMPHFHLPLQSGSDQVLKAMGRHYDTGTYRSRLMKAVSAISGCGIGADVMTGYPGESERDFEDMYRFLEDLPVAYLHVFTCSVRSGTLLFDQVARNQRKRVPRAEAAVRAARLARLAEEKERSFASTFIGKELRVLFEEGVDNSDGSMRWSGHSGNYLRVGVDVGGSVSRGSLRGEEHTVLVEGPGDGLHLQGRLLFS
jgi:threonylcarbamoyladenosine tRNA methylthiotransferase MtaB